MPPTMRTAVRAIYTEIGIRLDFPASRKSRGTPGRRAAPAPPGQTTIARKDSKRPVSPAFYLAPGCSRLCKRASPGNVRIVGIPYNSEFRASIDDGVRLLNLFEFMVNFLVG